MTVSDGKYTDTINLDAGTYTFKITNGTDWYGNNGTIADTTGDNAWVFATNEGNCTLTATGGAYTFTFDADTKKVTVTYVPEESESESESQPVDTDTVIYLDASKVTKNDEIFYAYTWSEGQPEKWLVSTETTKEGYLKYKSSMFGEYVIFVRCNKNADNPASWCAKWNQTDNLTIPTDGKNLYTISDWGGEKMPGDWSTYAG